LIRPQYYTPDMQTVIQNSSMNALNNVSKTLTDSWIANSDIYQQSNQNTTAIANIQNQMDKILADPPKNLEEKLSVGLTALEQKQKDLSALIDAQTKQLKNLELLSAKTDLNTAEIENLETALGIEFAKDKDGNVIGVSVGATELLQKLVTKTLETQKIVIDVKKDEDATIGESTIAKGKTSVTILNSFVNKDSKIFVTPRVKTEQTLAVTEIKDGEFTVEVSNEVTENDGLSFDWWIVEIK
jgi:hypothetical protein